MVKTMGQALTCSYLLMDTDTVMWWLGQGDSAWSALNGGEPVRKVLRDFALWLEGKTRRAKMWGNERKIKGSGVYYLYKLS